MQSAPKGVCLFLCCKGWKELVSKCSGNSGLHPTTVATCAPQAWAQRGRATVRRNTAYIFWRKGDAISMDLPYRRAPIRSTFFQGIYKPLAEQPRRDPYTNGKKNQLSTYHLSDLVFSHFCDEYHILARNVMAFASLKALSKSYPKCGSLRVSPLIMMILGQ